MSKEPPRKKKKVEVDYDCRHLMAIVAFRIREARYKAKVSRAVLAAKAKTTVNEIRKVEEACFESQPFRLHILVGAALGLSAYDMYADAPLNNRREMEQVHSLAAAMQEHFDGTKVTDIEKLLPKPVVVTLGKPNTPFVER